MPIVSSIIHPVLKKRFCGESVFCPEVTLANRVAAPHIWLADLESKLIGCGQCSTARAALSCVTNSSHGKAARDWAVFVGGVERTARCAASSGGDVETSDEPD